MNNLDTQLHKLGEEIKLSSQEKAFHKAQLLNIISARRAVPSPFMLHFTKLRYVMVGALMIFVAFAGLSYAAEDSLPGSPLYSMKIFINEPMLLALTFDEQAKAELEVEFVDRRLKEYAHISVQKNVDPVIKQTVANNLAEHTTSAKNRIATLKNTSNPSKALKAGADLESTLTAHAAILKKVGTDEAKQVATQVETSREESEDINSEIAAAIEVDVATTSADVEAELKDQYEEMVATYAQVQADINVSTSSLDDGDKKVVGQSMEEIVEIIDEAVEKKEDGDSKKALLLFTEADQKLTELQTLLRADQNLGIDILNGTSTPATTTKPTEPTEPDEPTAPITPTKPNPVSTTTSSIDATTTVEISTTTISIEEEDMI